MKNKEGKTPLDLAIDEQAKLLIMGIVFLLSIYMNRQGNVLLSSFPGQVDNIRTFSKFRRGTHL